MSYELFDLHCHLDFCADPRAAARKLAGLGVAALSATVTPAGYERARAGLAGEPNVRVGVGLHPWWVADGTCDAEDVARVAELATSERFVAEVGLDYARGRDASRETQLAALDAALSACEGGGHVLSIHAVRSATNVLDALERHRSCEGNACILHWFSGTGAELARARKLGCLFSVGPRMLETRRGRAYARQIPADRLLLETDLPGSPEEGRALGAPDVANALQSALSTLCETRGEDVSATIAETSARLLGL